LAELQEQLLAMKWEVAKVRLSVEHWGQRQERRLPQIMIRGHIMLRHVEITIMLPPLEVNIMVRHLEIHAMDIPAVEIQVITVLPAKPKRVVADSQKNLPCGICYSWVIPRNTD
jgi:hypothetical protein